MRYILMFSLLSAPYLLHINVKLNVIIHKQIEAKHFHGPKNTFKHITHDKPKYSSDGANTL